MDDLIKYIDSCIEDNKLYVLYLQRKSDGIHYGKQKHGYIVDDNIISMTSEDDLKGLYELIINKYSSIYRLNYDHSFMGDYSLLVFLGENVLLSIESKYYNDRVWIYNEIHENMRLKK